MNKNLFALLLALTLATLVFGVNTAKAQTYVEYCEVNWQHVYPEPLWDSTTDCHGGYFSGTRYVCVEPVRCKGIAYLNNLSTNQTFGPYEFDSRQADYFEFPAPIAHGIEYELLVIVDGVFDIWSARHRTYLKAPLDLSEPAVMCR